MDARVDGWVGPGWDAGCRPARRGAGECLAAMGAADPPEARGLGLQGLPAGLMQWAQAVEDAPDEPWLAALTEAQHGVALVERWQALERYRRTRHQVRALALDAHGCTLRLEPGRGRLGVAPHPAESVRVLGVLVGLLRRIGTRDLRMRIVGDAHWRLLEDRWVSQPLPACAGTWTFAWEPPREPGTPPPRLATPSAVRCVLQADPSAPWTVRRLSDRLGVPPKTLQRRLQAAGTGFTALCDEVRVAQARRMLVEGRHGIDLVGYRCGFVDPAHFSRRFRAATGLSPMAYRSLQGALETGRGRDWQALRPPPPAAAA